MIPREKISTIRGRLDLFQLIEQSGRTIKGFGEKRLALCPFHSDTNPSLNVTKEKYRCFVCHARGDVFDWIRFERQISFYEAVKVGAALVGETLSEDGGPYDGPVVDPFEKPFDFNERLDRCRLRLPATLIPECWARRSFTHGMRYRVLKMTIVLNTAANDLDLVREFFDVHDDMIALNLWEALCDDLEQFV